MFILSISSNIHLLGTIMITFWPFWVPPGIWIIWLLWFWLACWMCTWSINSGGEDQVSLKKLIDSPAEVVPGSRLEQVDRSEFDRQLFGLFGAESGQWSLAEIELVSFNSFVSEVSPAAEEQYVALLAPPHCRAPEKGISYEKIWESSFTSMSDKEISRLANLTSRTCQGRVWTYL